MRIRKRMAPVAGALAIALAVTACSSSGDDSGGGGESGGTGGTELTVAWADNPAPINPATTSQQNTASIARNILDGLVFLSQDLKITPHLAKSWTVAPDGLSYTFELRDDVKFHDGTPFNAQAVVDNITYIADPATKSTVAVGLLGPCKTATADSEFQVTIKCTSKWAPLLTHLGAPYLGIQSPAAIKQYGPDLGEHIVGTGPFKLQSFTPNQSVVLVRNDDYNWAPEGLGTTGPAKLTKITLNIVPNPQARVSSLQSKQTQMIQKVPGALYKAMQKDFTAAPVPVPGLGHFASLNTAKFPTDSLAVRQAILYSVDRKAVVDLAEAGAFPPSNSVLQEGTLGYDASLTSLYPPDPAKAAELLQGDGWVKNGEFWQKDGKNLTISIGAFSDVAQYMNLAQAIQAQLKAAGIDAQIEQQGRAAYLDAAAKGSNNLTPTSYLGLDPVALGQWFTKGSLFNWSKYSDDELTGLLTQAQEENDLTKRLDLYSQVQKIVMEKALILPERPDSDLVLVAKNLQGFSYSGGGYESFYGASLSS